MSELTFCPNCGIHATSLGILGSREHFRCDGCGAEFSRETHKKQAKKQSLYRRAERSDKESRLFTE